MAKDGSKTQSCELRALILEMLHLTVREESRKKGGQLLLALFLLL